MFKILIMHVLFDSQYYTDLKVQQYELWLIFRQIFFKNETVEIQKVEKWKLLSWIVAQKRPHPWLS